MNFQSNGLKVLLILVSALTISSCSSKKSTEVVQEIPDSSSQQEIVQPQTRPQQNLQAKSQPQPKPQPKPQLRSQPKSKIAVTRKCLPISVRSCWMWKSYKFKK